MHDQQSRRPGADQLLADLGGAIRKLHRHAGEPSTREISRRVDRAVSHTTVGTVLKCAKTPTWGQVELVVHALGGRADEFHTRWIALRDAEDLETRPRHVSEQREQPIAGEVVVLKDHATLRFEDGTYKLIQRRLIKNIGDGHVNGYLVRIHVDRFVHFNRLSELYHLQYPLRGEDLNFKAWIGLRRKRPLKWVKNLVTSSVIERWLQFTDGPAGEGLAPQSETWIEYEYEVGQHQWGNWFQRTIRHWTKEVSVTVDFPSSLVWKREAVSVSYSTTSSQRLDEFKLASVPIDFRLSAGRSTYGWKITDPPLHARYRTEWSLPYWPTSQLDWVGVVQHDDRRDALTTPAQAVVIDTPSGMEDAKAIARRLSDVADSVERIHCFSSGMGLAAPQIGIPLQVILLRGGHGEDTFLVNPEVVHSEGEERDFEGCLSFFDVRGELVRPNLLKVRYHTLGGELEESRYEGRRARDVAHEIDHLAGVIYVDRMSDRDAIVLSPNLRRPDTVA